MHKYLFIILLLPMTIMAQSTRSLVNDGVDQYKEQNYADAELNFRKGIEKAPESYEANFNLGDAYYKQQKYDEAISSYNNAFKITDSKNDKAKVLHNIGNSLLKSNKIKESIEAYKSALKLNPDDMDTKYNLSYALQMLNQQQQNKDQQKDDKNKDDQKKDDQQQDQDNKDQNKDNKQQQDQQQQNKSPEDQKAQQDNLKQPKEENMSKEEAEQILNALKNNEQDLQKKLRKKAGVRVNTDKDW